MVTMEVGLLYPYAEGEDKILLYFLLGFQVTVGEKAVIGEYWRKLEKEKPNSRLNIIVTILISKPLARSYLC